MTRSPASRRSSSRVGARADDGERSRCVSSRRTSRRRRTSTPSGRTIMPNTRYATTTLRVVAGVAVDWILPAPSSVPREGTASSPSPRARSARIKRVRFALDGRAIGAGNVRERALDDDAEVQAREGPPRSARATAFDVAGGAQRHGASSRSRPAGERAARRGRDRRVLRDRRRARPRAREARLALRAARATRGAAAPARRGDRRRVRDLRRLRPRDRRSRRGTRARTASEDPSAREQRRHSGAGELRRRRRRPDRAS